MIETKHVFESKIWLRRETTWEQKEAAIEFARALGFQSESAKFPVTSFEEGLQVPERLSAISDFKPEVKEADIPEDYTASSDSALPMLDYDWRKERGLEMMFSKGVLLKDENLDQLPDVMNLHFVIPEDADDATLEAACNLAFRYGMETTAYSGRLVRKISAPGNEIIFEGGGACQIDYTTTGSGVKIVIGGEGEQLAAFVSRLCE